ncbi:hypothetical protein SUGI_0653030 [Cryptomeria japonica]|nr:hypothetical protein SUGI_0653030 [Cryptomeria japonica]
MKTYNAWRIFSILILCLTIFSVQIGSDEFWRPPQSSYPFAVWHISDNYAVGSTFESNLIGMMNNLVQNTSQTGFNMSSYGKNPNKVYGLMQCIGNASQSQCRQCAHNITRYTIDPNYQVCGQSLNCQIWFDTCYLRYANYSFVSVFEKDALWLVSSGEISLKYSKSPSVFRRTLEKLFSNLSAEACQDGSNGFAAQSAIYSTPTQENVDAFVECSRDLSSANCSSCLAIGFESMKPVDHLRAEFYHKNCLVRYVSTESVYASTETGNSAWKKPLTMWVVLIGGLLLSIFAPVCA